MNKKKSNPSQKGIVINQYKLESFKLKMKSYLLNSDEWTDSLVHKRTKAQFWIFCDVIHAIS